MNIHKAIKKINSNAEFTYKNDDVDTIEWLNNTTPISKEDIKAMIPIVEQEIKDEETAHTSAKTTGKAKLKTGDALTDAEIKALFGE